MYEEKTLSYYEGNERISECEKNPTFQEMIRKKPREEGSGNRIKSIQIALRA